MRKLIILLPLLMLPAFANAAHKSSLEESAYRLEASAEKYYRQVMHMRGNWRLKAEARQFANVSSRFARQVAYNAGPRQLNRSVYRLNSEFSDLREAVAYAQVRGKRKNLRKGLRKISAGLTRVENGVTPQARWASNSSRDGYRNSAYSYDSDKVRTRRYRN